MNNFAGLPDGVDIFVDANVFVYALAPDPEFGRACGEFLRRIEKQEIHGITSTQVVADVSHKLMILEARQTYGWDSKVVNKLAENPKKTSELFRYSNSVSAILRLPLKWISAESDTVRFALELMLETGLLTNDAIIASMMNQTKISHLASFDSDFDRVKRLRRYALVDDLH